MDGVGGANTKILWNSYRRFNTLCFLQICYHRLMVSMEKVQVMSLSMKAVSIPLENDNFEKW